MNNFLSQIIKSQLIASIPCPEPEKQIIIASKIERPILPETPERQMDKPIFRERKIFIPGIGGKKGRMPESLSPKNPFNSPQFIGGNLDQNLDNNNKNLYMEYKKKYLELKNKFLDILFIN
jgi:hypothetical protein